MTLKLNFNVAGGGAEYCFHSSLHLPILECDVSGAAVYLSTHLCLRKMNKVAGIGRSIYATPHSHSNWDPNDGLSTKMNVKNHNSCC